jgi:hypothetical protein
MDIPQAELRSLPVLTPVLGFASVSAPEITVETHDIQEANWPFNRKVVKRADLGNITLTRGSQFFDSDFLRWITYAVTGEPFGWFGSTFGGPTPRRDLLLVHYFSRTTQDIAGPLLSALVGGGAAALAEGGGGALAAGLKGAAVAALPSVTSLVQKKYGIGPFEFAARIPAKAWMLHGALPVRYKVGSDFDATAGEVSLMELDLALESMDEFAVMA